MLTKLRTADIHGVLASMNNPTAIALGALLTAASLFLPKMSKFATETAPSEEQRYASPCEDPEFREWYVVAGTLAALLVGVLVIIAYAMIF